MHYIGKENYEAQGFIFHPDGDRSLDEVNWYDELKYKTPRDARATDLLRMLKKAMEAFKVHKKSYRDLGNFVLRLQQIDDHRYEEWKKLMAPKGYDLHFKVFEHWKRSVRKWLREQMK